MWFGVFLLILSTCNAARILVYSPTISPSHMKINSAVADALVVAGHNVVRICVVLMQFKCVFKTIIEVHYMVDPQKVNFVKLAERKVFQMPESYAKSSTHKVDMAAVMKYAFKTPSYYEKWTFTRNYQSLFQRICRGLFLSC